MKIPSHIVSNFNYAAVIWNEFDSIVGVIACPTLELANDAGCFFIKNRSGFWFSIAVGRKDIDLFFSLVNVD